MILGFDSSTPITTVAVADRGRILHEDAVGPGPDGRPAAGRALLGMIETAVGEAGGWDRIATMAVGRGPGSFTGLRIAISTARALSQARHIAVAGVDSTAALAAAAIEVAGAAGRSRLGIVDARRGEVFAALDRGAGAGEPVVCAPGDLEKAFGTDLAGSLAVGDGAVRFRAEIEAFGCEVPGDEDPANRLSAAQICLLAANMDPGAAHFPAGVTPKYMRRPDAERWHERDHGT